MFRQGGLTFTPMNSGKRHSHLVTDGPSRAPARAMMKAIGFTDEDLAKPLIGIANMVLFTALVTIGSFIYNLCSDLVGGVEVTLADRD